MYGMGSPSLLFVNMGFLKTVGILLGCGRRVFLVVAFLVDVNMLLLMGDFLLLVVSDECPCGLLISDFNGVTVLGSC